MTQTVHPEGLSMLDKRKIEAEILKEVYETLKASHGVELAKKTVAESVRRIQSIALVHEMLSTAPDESVPFDEVADRVLSMVAELSSQGPARAVAGAGDGAEPGADHGQPGPVDQGSDEQREGRAQRPLGETRGG